MRFIGTVVSKVRNYVYRPARLAGSHVTPTCLNIVLFWVGGWEKRKTSKLAFVPNFSLPFPSWVSAPQLLGVGHSL